MGLKISTYKANGSEFTGAYAKVDNVRYDNNSKTATFELAVYPDQFSDNLIEKVNGGWVKAAQDVDIVEQCYSELGLTISRILGEISTLESAIATIEDEHEKAHKEFDLRRLKSNKMLQFIGEEL